MSGFIRSLIIIKKSIKLKQKIFKYITSIEDISGKKKSINIAMLVIFIHILGSVHNEKNIQIF
jgi:hypothetical protein